MGRPKIPVPKKFEEKYVPEPNTGCWIWLGSSTKTGYGRIGFYDDQTKKVTPLYAHRVSYEMYNGPIPPKMTVDHRCFLTSCVNPQYLQLLTRSENASLEMTRRHMLRSSHETVYRSASNDIGLSSPSGEESSQ